MATRSPTLPDHRYLRERFGKVMLVVEQAIMDDAPRVAEKSQKTYNDVGNNGRSTYGDPENE